MTVAPTVNGETLFADPRFRTLVERSLVWLRDPDRRLGPAERGYVAYLFENALEVADEQIAALRAQVEELS